MPKYLSLQINEPCHENWGNMNPNEQGKFCNSCQKTVVDFTTMTDTQVANYFKLNTGNTCGRFYDDQLNQTIALPRKEIPWLKYFFTITLPAFLFSLKATAQKKIEKTEVSPTKNIASPGSSYMGGGYTIYDSTSMKDTSKNKIMGEVWNKPNAFEELKVVTLEEVKVYSAPSCKRRMSVVAGGVSFRTHKEKSILTSNTPSTFKSKIKIENTLNIFPNPVLSNTTLNISFSNEILGEIVLEIFNANGNLVKKEERIIEFKTKHTYINTLNLVKGFYICRVTNKNTNEIFSKEFLVQ